ncbi:hypothetical protein COU58_04115 [Candidatus Pacearchaeota archaeon CG10_big_fil_rev_8_21_14_0_10_32_42]|nr:MAG: hypothetical protein COU58_04115 [Candidatus Pacearchaeota archaeon CG10_big_fil_rev_8_21_14_0_10_32_42]
MIFYLKNESKRIEKVVIHCNENKEQQYFILPKNGTRGEFVKGIEGCINYLLSYISPVEVEFSNEEGENKFNEDQKRAILKSVENHNKLKNLELII